MDYRIEKRKAFKLVCKKKHAAKPQGDTAAADISAFWNDVGMDGSMENICKHGRFDSFNGTLGVCFSGDTAETAFPYAVGTEWNGAPPDDARLDTVVIPANTYAVLQRRGKLPEAVPGWRFDRHNAGAHHTACDSSR